MRLLKMLQWPLILQYPSGRRECAVTRGRRGRDTAAVKWAWLMIAGCCGDVEVHGYFEHSRARRSVIRLMQLTASQNRAVGRRKSSQYGALPS